MTILKTSFGDFKGKTDRGIVQYLGIKYASLKDQLSPPEQFHSYGTEVIDATSYGPRSPAMDGCEFEQNVLIQQNIGIPPSPPMSGTECLNLNITMPVANLPTTGAKYLLPVMVFIHGGGFIMGSNHWPQYNSARLVKLSTDLGMPVILVNINYRLGVLGNMTSNELRAAGYQGNNSLRDQKCALHWIKAHIAEFGGDAENLTAFGESAGAAAVLYQLYSKEPLFQRAISMSGTPIMLKPLPTSVTETTYSMIMTALDLENASVGERIRRLTTITPEELVAKTPISVPITPYLDGDIVPVTTTFASLAAGGKALDDAIPGRKWCRELIIGDCQHDGTVFFNMGLADRSSSIASALHTSLITNLNTEAARAILQAYDIAPGSTATSNSPVMKSILELGNDIAFHLPALRYAQFLPKTGRSYYYHFDEPNPWDGEFKGCATHLLDAAFLFQNFGEKLPGDRERGVGKDMAEAFVKFASGVKNVGWESGVHACKTFRNGNESGTGNGRRDILVRLEKEGKLDLDGLSIAWDCFIAGK